VLLLSIRASWNILNCDLGMMKVLLPPSHIISNKKITLIKKTKT